jgi:hypothetical protein
VWTTRSAAPIRRAAWAVCGIGRKSSPLCRCRRQRRPWASFPSLEAPLRYADTSLLPHGFGAVSGRKPRFGWNRRIGGISMSFLCWEPCGWRHGLLILFAFLRCLSLSKVDLLGRYVRRRRRVQDDAFFGGRPSPAIFSFDGASTKESSLAGVDLRRYPVWSETRL